MRKNAASPKGAFILMILIFAASSYLFKDHYGLVMNGELKNATVVGCDSKYFTRTSGGNSMNRRKVMSYTPIAVSESEEKAVGTLWYKKDWCEKFVGRSVQIYVHPEEFSKNRIASFFQFWFLPSVAVAIVFVAFVSIVSTNLSFLAFVLYFLGASGMIVHEFGLLNKFSPEARQVSGDVSELSLNQCVREAMEKEKVSERAQVKRVLCQDAGITDLSSIADLMNLEELYLQGNKLGSLDSVPIFSKLRKISVAGMKSLISLKGIERLPTLEELQGNKSSIEDLSGVEVLKNLKVVGLMQNKIRDVSVFSDLAEIEDITLSYNQISDISAFANKPKLRDFQVYSNMVSNVRPLFDNSAMEVVGIGSKGGTPCAQIVTLRSLLPNARIYGPEECD